MLFEFLASLGSNILVASAIQTATISILGIAVLVLTALHICQRIQRKKRDAEIAEMTERLVTERTQVIREGHSELSKRQTISKILSEISTRFITLAPSAIDSEIPKALSRIAKAMKAQRASIFLPPADGPGFNDENFYVDLSYEWFEPIVGPIGPSFQRVVPRQFKWVSDRYFKGNTILAVSPKDLPGDAIAEQKLFELMKWTSVIIIPLFVGKRFIGNLNFSTIDYPFTWPQVLVEEIKIVGEIFANALDRKQNSFALHTLRQDAIDAEERERKRISRELHDQLGGALTGLKIQAMTLQKNLKKIDSDLTVHVDQIASIIDDTILDVRRICSELRPAILDELDLPQALEWQAEQFTKQTGIPCEFDMYLPQNPPRLRERDIAVYRITQELFTNVIRHADAKKVQISLTCEENQELVLTVADDGRGFDAEKLSDKSRHFGLRGIRERTEHFNGKLSIQPREDSGVVVKVWFPSGVNPS